MHWFGRICGASELRRRPPSDCGSSAEPLLELDHGMAGVQLDWQVEFITSTVGDTNHSSGPLKDATEGL
jgi:hypothetical protein